ncbi:MAG: choice-of-anchor R domain-containing protein [Terriglobales bacterium]
MVRKPAVRIVIVLSVLTLAGIAALAAAGHHGIVTSQDGRMSIAQHGPSHVTPFNQPATELATIAGNLSKYPYGTFFCCYGYTISGPDSFLGAAYWVAIPFTPTANYKASRIEVAVGWGGEGVNGVTVSLNADSNGLPGSVIASIDKTGLSDYGDCCQLVVAGGGSGATVNQGTQYWVVVSTDASTETTFDAWAFNSTDMRAYPFASYSSTNGFWSASDGLLPGYAVLGTVQ